MRALRARQSAERSRERVAAGHGSLAAAVDARVAGSDGYPGAEPLTELARRLAAQLDDESCTVATLDRLTPRLVRVLEALGKFSARKGSLTGWAS